MFWPFRHCRFLSTLSLRRATTALAVLLMCNLYFYPRSPCGERRVGSVIDNVVNHFYPRSPCGERRRKGPRRRVLSGISIHALLAESDVMHALILADAMLFLSTLSLRRATSQQPDGTTRTTYFYPRSPCGERRSPVSASTNFAWISIHALLAESDFYVFMTSQKILKFLSTLSLRRATYLGAWKSCDVCYFYPRSPCGERQHLLII